MEENEARVGLSLVMKKGVSKMLSVEITAVLALVFTFFIYATLRARRTQERRRNEVRTGETDQAQETLA